MNNARWQRFKKFCLFIGCLPVIFYLNVMIEEEERKKIASENLSIREIILIYFAPILFILALFFIIIFIASAIF